LDYIYYIPIFLKTRLYPPRLRYVCYSISPMGISHFYLYLLGLDLLYWAYSLDNGLFMVLLALILSILSYKGVVCVGIVSQTDIF